REWGHEMKHVIMHNPKIEKRQFSNAKKFHLILDSRKDATIEELHVKGMIIIETISWSSIIYNLYASSIYVTKKLPIITGKIVCENLYFSCNIDYTYLRQNKDSRIHIHNLPFTTYRDVLKFC